MQFHGVNGLWPASVVLQAVWNLSEQLERHCRSTEQSTSKSPQPTPLIKRGGRGNGITTFDFLKEKYHASPSDMANLN